MSFGAEIVDLVDLSDNDDDCILESVEYKPKKKNYHLYFDNIFNENPLLAEVIEKCMNLESSEGMLRVINRTLLEMYKGADPNFKSSSEFETVLKRTLIRLDKDPHHKFSHIKDLCECLRSSKFKKRVRLITLEKNLRKKAFEKLSLKRKNYLERRNKKQKTDVIDLDKYEEPPFIDLDQNDSINDGPIEIDDEKENNSSQENSDCCIEINDDNGKMHNCTDNKTSEDVSSKKENDATILNIDDENEIQSSQESNDCFIEMNNEELRIHENHQSDNNIGTKNLENGNNNSKSSKNANFHKVHTENTEDVSINIDYEKQSHTGNGYCLAKNNSNNLLVQSKTGHSSHISPEKLLVPQKAFDLSVVDKHVQLADSKIRNIELLIARYKECIVKLEEQEVTDDSCSSPYIMSDKYKEKIVKLYKELCTLTGAEATKRREVRLTVIEGHPPGPVRRLEMFLNRNIGEDGNPPFPDFNDVVKCVETANVNDNLGWNKFQVMREASALFMHCGRALQKRRQKREWSDLLSRVKAEECDSDPADNDPELLARLEVNRRVAVKKEADLLERYSMMQNLPPEPKRNTATNVTQSQDAVKITSVTSGNDDSSDEIDSPQVNKNENNILTLTKENKINQLDSIKIGSVNCNPKAHSEIETNKINLVQNASLVMPQIIAESITNKSYTDEFGLKINDSKGISNVQDNYSTSNVTVKSESNVAEVDFETNVALNKTARLIARLAFESNAEANCKSNIKSNLGVVNFESNVETNKIHVVGLTFESNVEENCESNIKSNLGGSNCQSNVATNKNHVGRLAFEPNVEANCKSNKKSNLGVVNFESNVGTDKIHVVGLTFESNVEENCETNIKSNLGDCNCQSNVATNKNHVERLAFEPNVEANYEFNMKSNVGDVNFESNVAPNKTQVGEVNFESNVVTNKTHVSRLALESNFEDGNLKANIVEVKFEPNVEQVNTESNAEENFESNSEEVNSIEASVKTEFDEANIKTEPTENVAKILDDFGDNYTVSIFDFADPFLIVEISDSSDDED